MRKFPKIEVIWFDAQSSLEVRAYEELDYEEMVISRSLGYLMFEDKDKIILAFTHFGKLGYGCIKHWQVIPKGMIKRIKYLK